MSIKVANRKLLIINGFKKAFTLIELLIVISIFGVITSSITVSYVSFTQKQNVVDAARGLITKLRFVQNTVQSGTNTCEVQYPLPAQWELYSYNVYIQVHSTDPYPLFPTGTSDKPNFYQIGNTCLESTLRDSYNFGYEDSFFPDLNILLSREPAIRFTKIEVDSIEYPQIVIAFRKFTNVEFHANTYRWYSNPQINASLIKIHICGQNNLEYIVAINRNGAETFMAGDGSTC